MARSIEARNVVEQIANELGSVSRIRPRDEVPNVYQLGTEEADMIIYSVTNNAAKAAQKLMNDEYGYDPSNPQYSEFWNAINGIVPDALTAEQNERVISTFEALVRLALTGQISSMKLNTVSLEELG